MPTIKDVFRAMAQRPECCLRRGGTEMKRSGLYMTDQRHTQYRRTISFKIE
jgi:predicted nucleic acid-binding Zn ribbon protein